MKPDNPNYPSGIESLTIDAAGFKLGALHCKPRQNDPVATRLLCVHGWLDNAASFVPLMQKLGGLEIVAIDLPGHGWSDHLGKSGDYSLADMALLLPRVVDALGWQNCHLLGHSLGGNISLLSVVAAPEQFQSLVLLESSGPLTGTPESLPDRLKKASADRAEADKYKSRLFKNTASAVASRLAAARMSDEAARLVVERQLIPATVAEETGFLWRFDPRLRLTSPVYMMEEQIRALLAAVTQPALAVVADKGFLSARDETAPRLALLNNGNVVNVPGNHHMHMDDPLSSAVAISQHLDKFET